jgi:hypothetical protein
VTRARAARWWLTAGIAGASALVASTALAGEPPPQPSKYNAISYKPLSILSRGLTVQYERLVAPLSLVAGMGLRPGAGDDFSSLTWVTRVEARWWFLGREPISDFVGMGGPFAGVAFDVGRTELESKSLDRSLGVAWTLEESLRIGYRFVLFGVQEITPAATALLLHDVDQQGRLAPSTRASFGFDLTTGWLF